MDDPSFVIHDEPTQATREKPPLDESMLLDQEFDRLLGPVNGDGDIIKPVQQPANPLPLPNPSIIAMAENTSPVGQAASKTMLAMKTALGSAADLLSKQASVGKLGSNFLSAESIENPFLNAEIIESLRASQEDLLAEEAIQTSHNRLELPTEFMDTMTSGRRGETNDYSFQGNEKDTVVEDLEYDQNRLAGKEDIDSVSQIEVPCEYDISFRQREADEESTVSTQPVHRKIANISYSPEIVKGLEEIKRKMDELEMQNARLKTSVNNSNLGGSSNPAIVDGSLEQLKLSNTIVSLKSRITILKRRLDYAQFIENNLMKERNSYLETIAHLREELASSRRNGFLTDPNELAEMQRQLRERDQIITDLRAKLESTVAAGAGNIFPANDSLQSDYFMKQLQQQRDEIIQLKVKLSPLEHLERTIYAQETQIADLKTQLSINRATATASPSSPAPASLSAGVRQQFAPVTEASRIPPVNVDAAVSFRPTDRFTPQPAAEAVHTGGTSGTDFLHQFSPLKNSTVLTATNTQAAAMDSAAKPLSGFDDKMGSGNGATASAGNYTSEQRSNATNPPGIVYKNNNFASQFSPFQSGTGIRESYGVQSGTSRFGNQFSPNKVSVAAQFGSFNSAAPVPAVSELLDSFSGGKEAAERRSLGTEAKYSIGSELVTQIAPSQRSPQAGTSFPSRSAGNPVKSTYSPDATQRLHGEAYNSRVQDNSYGTTGVDATVPSHPQYNYNGSSSSVNRTHRKKIELTLSNDVLKSHLKQELRRKILAERGLNSNKINENPPLKPESGFSATIASTAAVPRPPAGPWDDLNTVPKWQNNSSSSKHAKADEEPTPQQQRSTDRSKISPLKKGDDASLPARTKLNENGMRKITASDGEEWADGVYRKNVSKGKWPFITSGNARTYSLPANVQKVWAMLKNHDPQDCDACASSAGRSIRPAARSRSTLTGKRNRSASAALANVKLGDINVSLADIKDAIEHLEREYKSLNENYDGLLNRYKNIPSSLLIPNMGDGEKEQLAGRLRGMLNQMEDISSKIAKLRDVQRQHSVVAPREPRSRSVASARSAAVSRQPTHRGSSVLSKGTASDYNRQAARELQQDLEEMTKSIENLGQSHPPPSPRRRQFASPSAKLSQILSAATDVGGSSIGDDLSKKRPPRQRSMSTGLGDSGRQSPAKVALDIFKDAKRVQRRLVDWEDVDHAFAFGGQPVNFTE